MDERAIGSDEPTVDAAVKTAANDVSVHGPIPAADEQALQRIGPFVLLELLGQGGMGEVYRAVHDKLKKTVALKLLPAERLEDPQAMSRFRREVQVVSGLSHPNIVRFENAGEAEGVPYLVMEYVRGIDLERLVRRLGRLPVPDACQLIGQAAIGLHHAHQAGLVHRDIKPANLMLASTGAVKILDLGVALLVEPSVDMLTSPGQLLGNVECLAPEQARFSHQVDARADLYALGCTFFRLLTGRAVFPLEECGSAQAVVQAHLDTPPPKAIRICPQVPKELSAVVDRLLAKNPADRYDSAAALAGELVSWAQGCDLPALLDKAELAMEPPASPDVAHLATVDYLKSALSDTTVTRQSDARNEQPAAEFSPSRSKARKLGLAAIAISALVLFGMIPLFLPRPTPDPRLVIDWSTVDWPARMVTERVYSFGDVHVTIRLDGDVQTDARHDTPNNNLTLHGGLSPPERNLFLDLGDEQSDRSMNVHISFSEPVKEVRFKLFDVDRSETSEDHVAVSGWHEGREVRPSIATGQANHVEEATGVISGRSASADQGAGSSAGNVTVYFEQPLDEIRLDYRRIGIEPTGSVQGIGLHDMHFTKAKPICDEYTLDWDRVDWCRADRMRTIVGEVDLAVSLSGDAVQPTRSVRVGTMPNPRMQRSGKAPALVWSAEWQKPRQAATATFDFSQPVKDLTFAITGLACSSYGVEDEVAVLGFLGGRLVDGPRLEVLGGGRVDMREIAGSVQAAFARGTSSGQEATVQVCFDDAIDRFVVQIAPRESNARDRQAVRRSSSAEEPAIGFPHVTEVAVGEIRFLPADQEQTDASADGRAASVLVPATANPWTAGMDWEQLAAEDTPTDQRAIPVNRLALQAGATLAFSVSGTVREQRGMIERSADGGQIVRHPGDPKRGFPAAQAPLGSLVGVFLGELAVGSDQLETTSPCFGSAMIDETVAPALGQVFFVGDGQTPNGNVQQFFVPAGATDLYLATMDDQRWSDNIGWLAVEVTMYGPAELPQAPPDSPVVDLLARVSPDRDTTRGIARMDNGALVLGGERHEASTVQIPFNSPNYGDVALTVERISGTGSLAIGLSAGQARIMPILDEPTSKGPATTIAHHGTKGPLTTNTDYVPRLPASQPVDVRISVIPNRIGVFCDDALVTQCVCPHHTLRTSSYLESPYPNAIFVTARGGSFRISRMTLTLQDELAEPIRFSDPDQSPEQAAAELAIWKGASIRLLVDGRPSRHIDHLRDLPPQAVLHSIDVRDSRRGTALDDHVLAVIGRTGQLQSADLSHSRITDDGLPHLTGLRQLRVLDLSHTSVSGRGLAAISQLARLEVLGLEQTEIADDDLPLLHSLPELRELRLHGTKVSAEGLDEFQRQIPKVEVIRVATEPSIVKKPPMPPEDSPSAVPPTTTQKPSPKLRFPGNGHYYQRIDTPMSWHEAKRHCESLGGYLATITSAEENDFVYKNFAADHVCWLGATDEAEEDKWVWITGEPFVFRNWSPGEPSNSGQGEHHLTIGNSPDVIEDGKRYFYRFGSRWNDHAEHGRYRGQAIVYPLCEWDDDSVPSDETTDDNGS